MYVARNTSSSQTTAVYSSLQTLHVGLMNNHAYTVDIAPSPPTVPVRRSRNTANYTVKAILRFLVRAWERG